MTVIMDNTSNVFNFFSNEQQSVNQCKLLTMYISTHCISSDKNQRSTILLYSRIHHQLRPRNWAFENMNQVEWCWGILLYHIFKLPVNTNNIWHFFDSKRIMALSHLVHKAAGLFSLSSIVRDLSVLEH